MSRCEYCHSELGHTPDCPEQVRRDKVEFSLTFREAIDTLSETLTEVFRMMRDMQEITTAKVACIDETVKRIEKEVGHTEKPEQAETFMRRIVELENKNARLESRLDRHGLFYTCRMNRLQALQGHLPEPYRTIVCDILANGFIDIEILRSNIAKMDLEQEQREFPGKVRELLKDRNLLPMANSIEG